MVEFFKDRINSPGRNFYRISLAGISSSRQPGDIVLTAQQVYKMLEKQTLWQAAKECHRILTAAKIPHALVGGVAVCLHGYQRSTIDVDLLIRKEDAPAVREILEEKDYAWQPESAEFRSADGIAIQFLHAGAKAGSGSEVALPDPGDSHAITEIEGLAVLTLARLIEAKIACGEGNLRRTHKDFADVVELIIQNELDSSFARYLHKSLRGTYRTLVRASRGKP